MLRKSLLHLLFLAGLSVQIARAQATIRFDPSFAEAGLVTTALGGNFEGATTHEVLPDGRYVLAGGTNLPFVDGSGGFDLAVLAYRPDGSLDEGFGVGGIVRLDLDQANGADEWAYALAADPAGSVVVAGYAKQRGEEDEALLVARLEADGRLDPDFGDGGIVTLDLTPNDDRGVAIFPVDEGRLLVGIQNAGDFMAVRLTSDGALDPTYGVGGIASMDLGGHEMAFGFTLDAEGRLVAAGSSGSFQDVAVVRWTPEGRPDPTFGGGGWRIIDAGGGADRASLILEGADGSLSLLGHTGSWPEGAYVQLPMIIHLTDSGDLDSMRGEAGIRILTELGHATTFRDASPRPDGRWLAALSRLGQDGTVTSFFAAFHPDGSFDRTYGADGVALLPVRVVSFSVLEGGLTVASVSAGGSAFALARFIDDLSVDAEDGQPRALLSSGSPRSVSVYPNPVDACAVARLSTEHVERVTLTLMDGLGRRIQHVFSGALVPPYSEFPIDVAGLPSGTYLLQVRGERGVTSSLLVKATNR